MLSPTENLEKNQSLVNVDSRSDILFPFLFSSLSFLNTIFLFLNSNITFQCADYEVGDHSPANCHIVDKWKKKSKDESENVNWMIANTKKCPKCRAPIEKNGGCMHMVCRKNCGGCGFEFCWLCRGNWAEHGTHTGGYYNCNKYDASDAKKKDQSAADVRTELELYIFYYHRYESHLSAGKIAKSQRITAEQRANELQKKFEIRSEDTRFLTEATEQLLRVCFLLFFKNIIEME